MHERDLHIGHRSSHRTWLGVATIGAMLALGEPIAPQDVGAVPLRVSLATPTAPEGSSAANDDRTFLAVCRASLRDDAAVARAAVVLTRALPAAPWRALLVSRLPRDIPTTAQAAVSTVGEEDPVIYWRPPLQGSALLHELVHAWQATLPEDEFVALLDRLARRDARHEFSASVVDQATSSVLRGIALFGPDADGRLRRLVFQVAPVDANRRGALRSRADAIAALVATRGWEDVRTVLLRGLSTRQPDPHVPRDWQAWLRVFILVEAQAYEAQERCAAGARPLDWVVESGASSPQLATSSSARPTTVDVPR